MKKIMMLCVALMGVFILYQLGSPRVSADEVKDSFGVGTVFSEHQTDKADSFYDIRWTPGVSDTFGLRITNHADHEKTFLIQLGKARTNSTGSINYTDNLPETEALKYKLVDLVTIAREVTVPAESSQTVNGTVHFANEDYNGILIGGLNISEKRDTAEKSKAAIQNVISYTIPLVLRGNIDSRPDPEVKFDGLDVKQLTAESYSVNTKVDNVQPTLLKGAKFKAAIENAAGKVIDTQDSQIDITPETKFDYPVELKGNYPAGEYKALVEITQDTHQWNYEKKFTIDVAQAKKLAAIQPKENFFKKYQLELIAAGILLAILIVILLFRWKRSQN